VSAVTVVKVGINGFGRIGRITFRALVTRPEEFDVVAINDLGDPKALAMLLKYDSVQGRFPGTVAVDGSNLIVNGRKVRVCAEKDPAKLPWKELKVDVALESTGFFTGRKTESKPGYDSHLDAGARKWCCRPRKRCSRFDGCHGCERQRIEIRAQVRLERQLHHELPGTDGESSAREFWD
jgi:hypothetical protein